MSKIGAQLAAEAIIEKGIEYIFTLSGGHITPIYQYLEESSIKLIDTRHEQAAAFMAEAYGRLTRKPGICLVTAGPGFTNCLSGVANAMMSNAPMLIISGAVGLECCEKLDLQDMRQLPVIEPMVKKAYICQNPERCGEFIDMAYRTCLSGKPGPVYLELPVDVLNAQADDTKIRNINTLIDKPHPVDLSRTAPLVEMIQQAKKPIVIAGSGVWYSEAEKELVEFADLTGVPVFTSAMGRGTIPDDHPMSFQSSLMIRPGASLAANMETDLVILLGTRISLLYVFGDIFQKDTKFVQVDINQEEIGRNRSIDLPVVSDIKAFLTASMDYIKKEGVDTIGRFQEWRDHLRKSEKESMDFAGLLWEKKELPIHAMRLAHEINSFMDRKDDIVIADGGDTQIWMGMTRTVRKGGHYMDSGLFGCLAVGLPYANTAKLINPDKRVCLIIGDGATGFNFMEFESAIRHNIPIVVVIADDKGWGMIRHSQEIRMGHAIPQGTELGKIDYYKMVEVLGGNSYYVDDPDKIQETLEEAFASGKVSCIQVPTDPTTVSPGSTALANLGGYKAE